MGKYSNLPPEEQCQYRRCGGKGSREVARPWRAWTRVMVNGREAQVCESCANLLRRSGATRSGAPGVQELAPARVDDIMRAMSLPFEPSPATPAERRNRKNGGSHPRSTRTAKQVQPSGEKHSDIRPTSPPTRPSMRDDAQPDATRAPLAESRVDESMAAPETGARHIRRRPGGNIAAAHPVARAKRSEAPHPKSADETASPEQRLRQLFRSHGCKVVDSRPKGGALWIVGGKELEPTIREARALGYAFTWSGSGGKKTKRRAGWWCKRMRR